MKKKKRRNTATFSEIRTNSKEGSLKHYELEAPDNPLVVKQISRLTLLMKGKLKQLKINNKISKGTTSQACSMFC